LPAEKSSKWHFFQRYFTGVRQLYFNNQTREKTDGSSPDYSWKLLLQPPIARHLKPCSLLALRRTV